MFTFFYPGCSYGFTQTEWIGGSGRKQHQAHRKRKVHGKSSIFAMVKDACGTCKLLLRLLCISRDSRFASKSQMALNLRFRAGKSHGKSGKTVSRCFFHLCTLISGLPTKAPISFSTAPLAAGLLLKTQQEYLFVVTGSLRVFLINTTLRIKNVYIYIHTYIHVYKFVYIWSTNDPYLHCRAFARLKRGRFSPLW